MYSIFSFSIVLRNNKNLLLLFIIVATNVHVTDVSYKESYSLSYMLHALYMYMTCRKLILKGAHKNTRDSQAKNHWLHIIKVFI